MSKKITPALWSWCYFHVCTIQTKKIVTVNGAAALGYPLGASGCQKQSLNLIPRYFASFDVILFAL
jgi:hypothetical protein